jgi:cytochrome c biogenesis factor
LWASDLYLVVGETSADGSRISVRAYYVPMIDFIWAGFILIAMSGLAGLVRKTL